MLGGLLMIALFALSIVVPLLVYHFLIFPNVDGVAQDLSWFNYDGQSQHFLYWLGFWSIVILAAITCLNVKANDK